ncbi:BQ5605_C015g07853 [Microbotryum silenes-dioicae]|uniref:BQ5605_C015g07853 protein n=1 Tax=Microbotryum silenes-dioicae TaxID=796604 RepID=A0A2X0LTG1_9BASI|nr:BQ5605_C015g07853 [Microbotryum silenes-dioicae]
MSAMEQATARAGSPSTVASSSHAEYCRALHDFSPQHPSTCLAFSKGEVIRIFGKDQSGWWDGELRGTRGWFPSNYVQVQIAPNTISSTAVASPATVDRRVSLSILAQPSPAIAVRAVTSCGYGLELGATPTAHVAKCAKQCAYLCCLLQSTPKLPPKEEQSVAYGSRSHSSVAFGHRNSGSREGLGSREDLGPRDSATTAFPERGSTLDTVATTEQIAGFTTCTSPKLEQRATAFERESQTLVAEVQNAVTLVQAAVNAQRVPHYQPTTACVISSVRTVLASSDCLTRESPFLKCSSALATCRKKILASLASLVNQARRASSPSTTIEQSSLDAQVMLDVARQVAKQVDNFLDEARVQGLPLIPTERLVDDRRGSPHMITPPLSASNLLEAHPMRVAKSAPLSTLRIARSNGDLKAHRAVQPPTPLQLSPIKDFPSTGQSFLNIETSPKDLDVQSPSSTVQVVHNGNELASILSKIHDILLSTIAALIGHVHAHSRSAPAASFARLIDITREIIEHIRSILLIVEAVTQHPTLLTVKSDESSASSNGLKAEVDNLAACRDRLYVATTALVTAARVASSVPAKATSAKILAISREDEERKDLLQAATAVLRAGGDTVSAVRLCVGYAGEPNFTLLIGNPPPTSPTALSSPTTLTPPTGPDDGATRRPEFVGRRGPHTLSMLGRKATSLSCLTGQYDSQTVTGTLERFSVEEEDETVAYGRDGEHVEAHVSGLTVGGIAQGRARKESASSGDETVTSKDLVGRRGPQQAGETYLAAAGMGAGSPPMVRGDSSRTSQSCASSRSGVSTVSTNDSSPRSSTSTAHTEPSSTLAKAGASIESFAPMSLGLGGSSRISVHSSSGKSSSDQSTTLWFLERNYEAREISFNADGRVTGGTLRCLVERMTLHDTTIDPLFSNTFFLTFRMFTSPPQLVQALFARFDIAAPQGLDETQLKLWNSKKLIPVRLRVYNFLKTWVESYWKVDQDLIVLEPLRLFCQTRLAKAMSNPSARLMELLNKRERGTDVVRSSTPGGVGPLPQQALAGAPSPIVNKSLLNSIKFMAVNAQTFSIVDVDPLELTRQITILESRVYSCIGVEELLSGDFAKPDGFIRQMSTMSTKLTGWITETIVNESESKKRTTLLKYFVKVADQPLIAKLSFPQRCFQIKNYNTLFAVLCALNSSTVARLRRTWDALAPKYRVLLDQLRKATDHARNYAEYRATVRQAVPPCLPFVGLFLYVNSGQRFLHHFAYEYSFFDAPRTDITMCSEGNPPFRPSPVDPSLRLINFDRFQKMSRIVGDLQRFQVPYNFFMVPELQTLLTRALNDLTHGGDAASLYRQSLLVEPRNVQSSASSAISGNNLSKGSDSFNWK